MIVFIVTNFINYHYENFNFSIFEEMGEDFRTTAYFTRLLSISRGGKLVGHIQAKISQLKPSNTQLMQTKLPILVNQ